MVEREKIRKVLFHNRDRLVGVSKRDTPKCRRAAEFQIGEKWTAGIPRY